MIPRSALLGLLCSAAISFPALAQDRSAIELPLRPMSLEQVASPDLLGWDEQLWGATGDRQALITAIDYSLEYLQTPAAVTAYANYPVQGVTRDRVQRSLERFRELLLNASSAADLRAAILREFSFYQSVGNDGEGTVHFTGYFEPIYAASRVRTAEYRYPLYRRPADLEAWTEPHPRRVDLEGVDGMQAAQSELRGLELVWLRDRLEAYLVQVQGSAKLQLTDGTTISVGYNGRTNHEYTSLGRELVNDGKFLLEEISLPVIIEYFRQHPDELSLYLPRNDRFIFFQETDGGSPQGTLEVPVTAERSIATDKSIMPMGALALIHTDIPYPDETGQLIPQQVSRFVLNQDTGGAIQGAGRVDIFLGTGVLAGDRAGILNSEGTLYFLLLRE